MLYEKQNRIIPVIIGDRSINCTSMTLRSTRAVNLSPSSYVQENNSYVAMWSITALVSATMYYGLHNLHCIS